MIAPFAPLFNRVRAVLRRAPVCSLAPLLAEPCPLTHPQAPLPTWVADDPLVRKEKRPDR